MTYRLYRDVNNTPYDTGDDTLVTTLAYDPAGKTLGDFGGTMGSPRSVQNFGNSMITITIPLPDSYGSGGLTPAGSRGPRRPTGPAGGRSTTT